MPQTSFLLHGTMAFPGDATATTQCMTSKTWRKKTTAKRGVGLWEIRVGSRSCMVGPHHVSGEHNSSSSSSSNCSSDDGCHWPTIIHYIGPLSLMRLQETTCWLNGRPARTHWSATTPALHCCDRLGPLSARSPDHSTAANPINRSIYNFWPYSSTPQASSGRCGDAACPAKPSIVWTTLINRLSWWHGLSVIDLSYGMMMMMMMMMK